jgi:hypothetical protein
MRMTGARVIAQAVSRRLPRAAARVRAQVRSCGICAGHSSTGVGFLRVLPFPLQILIPPTAPHSSSITRAGTIGQIVADVPSGLSLTPPEKTEWFPVPLVATQRKKSLALPRFEPRFLGRLVRILVTITTDLSFK